jgi:hypothetical protein
VGNTKQRGVGDLFKRGLMAAFMLRMLELTPFFFNGGSDPRNVKLQVPFYHQRVKYRLKGELLILVFDLLPKKCGLQIFNSTRNFLFFKPVIPPPHTTSV